jgi:hypothetical protein
VEEVDEPVTESEYHLDWPAHILALGRRAGRESVDCEETIRTDRSAIDGIARLDAEAA